MESLKITIHSEMTKVLICLSVSLLTCCGADEERETEEDERSLIRTNEYSALPSLHYTSHLSKEEVMLKSNRNKEVQIQLLKCSVSM